MNQFITPEQYAAMPPTVKRDYHKVQIAGIVPLDLLALRKLDTGEFFALVTIPALNDGMVREVRILADDVLEIKETPAFAGD